MKRNAQILLACLLFTVLMTGCQQGQGNDTAEKNVTDSFSSGEIAETETVKLTEAATTQEASVQNVEDAHDGYIVLPSGVEYAELYADTDKASVLARLYQSDSVSVKSLEGDLASVSFEDFEGYVEIEYISFSKPSDPVQAELPKETTTATAQAVAAKETTSQKTTSAPNPATPPSVTLIFLTDQDGFSYASPLSYTNYVEEDRNAWCSAGSVYIYSEPNSSSYKREADMLYYSDPVTVLGNVNGYAYIATDSGNGYDLHGYVSQSYLTYGESPYQGEPEGATQGRVNVGSAKLRSSPNKENDENVIRTVYNGDSFTILSYDGYWYRVNMNGTIGYISHKMVEVW